MVLYGSLKKIIRVFFRTFSTIFGVNMGLKSREILWYKDWSLKIFLINYVFCFLFRDLEEEFWKLSPHENVARMRLKLEPQLYPNKHENAANLRDNATSAYDPK